jgi:hypothetical protein
MMGWSGHIARIADKRSVCKFLVGKPGDNCEYLGMHGTILLKWMP